MGHAEVMGALEECMTLVRGQAVVTSAALGGQDGMARRKKDVMGLKR